MKSVALLLLYLLGLGLYTQFSGFVEELPTFSQRMNGLVDNAAARVDDVEKRTYQVVIPKRFQEAPPPPGVPAPEAGRKRRYRHAHRNAPDCSGSDAPDRATISVRIIRYPTALCEPAPRDPEFPASSENNSEFCNFSAVFDHFGFKC